MSWGQSIPERAPRNTAFLIALFVAVWGREASAQAESDGPIDYEKQIAPIFKKYCYKCHSARVGRRKPKARLRLDTPEMILKGGEEGPVLVPGNPQKSELYKRISLPPDHDDVMPARGPTLKKEEIHLIRDWIVQRGRFGWKFLDFVFSFRPVTDEDRATVRALVEKWDSDDMAERAGASEALAKMEAPAWTVLQELGETVRSPEARARLRDLEYRFRALIKQADDAYGVVPRIGGLQRDVRALASIWDSRARKRLIRILSEVGPFSETEVPERGPKLAKYVADWMASVRYPLRWNAALDCYEVGAAKESRCHVLEGLRKVGGLALPVAKETDSLPKR